MTFLTKYIIIMLSVILCSIMFQFERKLNILYVDEGWYFSIRFIENNFLLVFAVMFTYISNVFLIPIIFEKYLLKMKLFLTSTYNIFKSFCFLIYHQNISIIYCYLIVDDFSRFRKQKNTILFKI